MKSKSYQKFKARITFFMALCVISGGLIVLSSCKILKNNKKPKNDVNEYKEQPALYGTPVSDYHNKSTN